MRILAVDPGYDRLGVCVIEGDRSNQNVIFSDCFETSSKDDFMSRLYAVGAYIEQTLIEYNCKGLAIESLFFAKNTKTALKVSEVRGAIIFAAKRNGLRVYEYTPNQIKVATTGYGNASKHDMYHMVYRLVSLDDKKRKDDEIDAIAIGITCFAVELFDTHI